MIAPTQSYELLYKLQFDCKRSIFVLYCSQKITQKGMVNLMETVRNGWVLSCPSVDGGVLCPGYYNAGAGLAEDLQSVTPEDSHMQIVTGVTEADFDAYLRKLSAAGLTLVQQTCQTPNRFADFVGGNTVFHISFFARTGEIRVVQDNVSLPVTAFSYETRGNQKTVFYQYGLYYDPLNRDDTGVTINCGMLYILRLSDNSLFMIDGGHMTQCSDEMMDGLWKFLHEITDTPMGGTIRIAAWYITHAHSDHLIGCAKLLNRHHDEIDLQRMMYNFPSYQVRPGGYDPDTDVMKRVVRQLYPQVPFLKPHTGQEITLSDLKIQVLYTHEDAVWTSDLSKFPHRDYNCTSTVLKLEIDGKSFLSLGDISQEAEAVIMMLSRREVWKGDMVQVAHHCFNFLNGLYDWIDAPVAVLPHNEYGAHTPDNVLKLSGVLNHVKDGEIYYAGLGTDGFQVEDGKFTHVYHADVIGGEYDHSGI